MYYCQFVVEISEGATKCCAACYNRIMRRVGPSATSSETNDTPTEGPNDGELCLLSRYKIRR